MKNIAVFASGSGTNFEAIINNVKDGTIRNGRVCLLVCDKQKAFCLERAKKFGIKIALVEREKYGSRKEFEAEVLAHLKRERIDLICLAGFMKILSPAFVKKYRNRILNIHPALLPSFKGAHAIKEALKYGVKVTGATVHFVTENLDAGPIILQEPLKISEDDTEESLLAKMHLKEHKIYAEAINLFCLDKLKIIGNKVKILGGGE